MKARQDIKSLFISDCHLGFKHSKAELLLQLLKQYNPENLFLVGDIIDGWELSRKSYWENTYSFIIRRIIGMIKRGTRVVYITGNHDEFLRKYVPNNFGNIELVNECVYESASGHKMLIIHGDIFDQRTAKLGFIYHLGSRAYSYAIWFNNLYNRYCKRFGLKNCHVSKVLKRNTKKVVNFINNFEDFMVEYTLERGCDSIVCGHIHHPEIKQVGQVTYYNCGDWVESCSAIVEHLDGKMELVELEIF